MRKGIKTRKGIIFSTDAVLAVVISSLLIFFSFNVLGGFERVAVDDLQLARISADLLRGMEKAGVFYNLTTKDAEVGRQEIANFTNVVPFNFCIYSLELKQYPAGTVAARFARIRGCQCTKRIVSMKRTYVYYNATSGNLDKYVVQLKSCYAERS